MKNSIWLHSCSAHFLIIYSNPNKHVSNNYDKKKSECNAEPFKFHATTKLQKMLSFLLLKIIFVPYTHIHTSLK
jgi:hypothetical protein